MENIKETMLDKKTWVVVGVTDKKDRFGYKIWKKLKEHGYTAYGVNPKLEELEGEKIYKTIGDLPEKVEVLNMVVGPRLAMNILDQAKEIGIDYIFYQPGSYDDEVIKKTQDLGLKYLDNDCIHKTLLNME